MKHITLPLADDTTDLWCGKCGITTIDDGKGYAWDCCDHFVDMVSHVPGRMGKRLRVCVEAEASHAALVRDAEAWRRVRSAVLTADRQRSIAAIVTGELEHG